MTHPQNRLELTGPIKRAYQGAAVRAHWFALAILIVAGALSFCTLSTFTGTIVIRQQLRSLYNELQATLNTAIDAETGQRGYLLTGDESYLEPFTSAESSIAPKIQRVESLLHAAPDQQAEFDQVKRLIEMKFAELKRTVELRRTEGFEAAGHIIQSAHGKQLMDEIRQRMDGIRTEIEELQADSDKKFMALATHATRWSTFGNILAAVLFVLVLRRAFADRKRAEERALELAERTSQLEAANKELDAFSYSMSHDLRAPLRAVDGFSRILLEEYGNSIPVEAKEYLQKVRDNTLQMGQLVDDLLAFARLGRQPLNKHPVEPEKLVRRCLEEMTKEQQGRDVEIVIGDLTPCEADPALLKQVWTNLLSNALKYTRKRETAHIEIGCRVEPCVNDNGAPAPSTSNEVVYFVSDNGAGFDMKYVRKLFGVFQRLHRAADYEGTGVGLAIVQRIIHRHGGRIWADASLNQGATFYFTIK